MQRLDRSRDAAGLPAAEFVPALACFTSHVDGRPAKWAFLRPRLASRLLLLDLRRLFGAKANQPRLIRLLHGALRVDAA